MKLSSIVDRYKKDLLSVARLSAAALSEKVITRTPVDKGDLRKSWTPSVNNIKAININGGPAHDYASVCNNLKAGDKYSLANGQPYARRIEYEGHSPQAPSGMLRVSAAEWKQIVRGAARGS